MLSNQVRDGLGLCGENGGLRYEASPWAGREPFFALPRGVGDNGLRLQPDPEPI